MVKLFFIYAAVTATTVVNFTRFSVENNKIATSNHVSFREGWHDGGVISVGSIKSHLDAGHMWRSANTGKTMLEARNFFFEARLFSAPIAFSLLSTLFFPISRHFSCRGESFVRAVNTCARASTPPFRARRDSFLFLDFFGVSFRLFFVF